MDLRRFCDGFDHHEWLAPFLSCSQPWMLRSQRALRAKAWKFIQLGVLKHFEPILGTVMALEEMLRAVEQAGSDDCGADYLRLRGLDALAELAAVSQKCSDAEDG
jgi:hypothetical protein